MASSARDIGCPDMCSPYITMASIWRFMGAASRLLTTEATSGKSAANRASAWMIEAVMRSS